MTGAVAAPRRLIAAPTVKTESLSDDDVCVGDRYRIDAVLGFGGMGVVYRARDLKLDQEIALKRIGPDRVFIHSGWSSAHQSRRFVATSGSA